MASHPDPETFGWGSFYRRFPDSGGNMYVSPVGFDAVKRRAIVLMGRSCGILCASSSFFFLDKADGVWQPVRPRGVQSCGFTA